MWSWCCDEDGRGPAASMLGADAQAQGRATFEGAVFEFQHGTALAITEFGTGRLFNVDLRSAGTLAPTGDPLLRLLAAPGLSVAWTSIRT